MRREFETTIVEFDEDSGIATVTLNRPDSLNALSEQLREDIRESLELLESKNHEGEGVPLRVVIMEGAEGNFCAGGDIHGFSDYDKSRTIDRTHFNTIIDLPVPVIAKIRGYCLGGGLETAMSCDFRIVHEDSQFGLPEAGLGILPGAGGQALVAREAGPSVAKELAMTGEFISAERAQDLGFINHVYGDDLDEEVQDFAETIAGKAPLSIQALKDGANMAVQVGRREARSYERRMFENLLESEDHEEGARGFAEDDYEPEFKGK